MKNYILLGLAAALAAYPISCFELPDDLEDGSYIVKFYGDHRDIALYSQKEYMIEQAALAATYNGTEDESEAAEHEVSADLSAEEEQEEEEDTPVDVQTQRHRNVEKCKDHYISPKGEALDAWEQLLENCVVDPTPRRPGSRDHHVAIVAKSGDAIAYMCHWGDTYRGNQCMLDELEQVEIMSPCREGTRLRPGGNAGEDFLVAARKDFDGPKRGYGYDIYQARHFCRHHGLLGRTPRDNKNAPGHR
ncbi:hypothetical protein F4809DRAFT_658430 [Biscogniauxia mediterranea]|nr:hypothetical protein F4809DRAFT_658430 [Biscogniauxia mediterranea]